MKQLTVLPDIGFRNYMVYFRWKYICKFVRSHIAKQMRADACASALCLIVTYTLPGCNCGKGITELGKNACQQGNFVCGQSAGKRVCKSCNGTGQFQRVHSLAMLRQFGFVHCAKGVLRRCIKGVELERAVSCIHNIVPRACRNDNGIVAKKGNSALVEKVNAALAELLKKDENGKNQIEKWFD